MEAAVVPSRSLTLKQPEMVENTRICCCQTNFCLNWEDIVGSIVVQWVSHLWHWKHFSYCDATQGVPSQKASPHTAKTGWKLKTITGQSFVHLSWLVVAFLTSKKKKHTLTHGLYIVPCCGISGIVVNIWCTGGCKKRGSSSQRGKRFEEGGCSSHVVRSFYCVNTYQWWGDQSLAMCV